MQAPGSPPPATQPADDVDVAADCGGGRPSAAAGPRPSLGVADARLPPAWPRPRSGWCELQGPRPSHEDACLAADAVGPLAPAWAAGQASSLYAVFDGHGGAGAARYAADALLPALLACCADAAGCGGGADDDAPPPPPPIPALLPHPHPFATQQQQQQPPPPPGAGDGAQPAPPQPLPPCAGAPAARLLVRALLRVDAALAAGAAPGACGATAVAALLLPPPPPPPPPAPTAAASPPPPAGWLAVAWLGDSRAVLCRAGGCAVALTEDHKPCHPVERARVVAAGGWVDNDGYLAGTLSVSRALGDWALGSPGRPVKPWLGLSGDPAAVFLPLAPTDEFLLLACDGLWDAVSSQRGCDVVRGVLRAGGGPAAAAQEAAREALRRGSTDNVTVLVVCLPGAPTGAGGGGGGGTVPPLAPQQQHQGPPQPPRAPGGCGGGGSVRASLSAASLEQLQRHLAQAEGSPPVQPAGGGCAAARKSRELFPQQQQAQQSQQQWTEERERV